MSKRVEFRQRAILDVDEIAEYIARDNLAAAQRFFDAVQETVNDLAAMPGLGRVRKFNNSKLQGMRSWQVTSFRNYLVFYFPSEHGIEVVRILHGARNLDEIFET